MEECTEKDLINIIDKLINEKIEKDKLFLRFTFYEVHVKNRVMCEQEEKFLALAKNKLENMGYTVYFQDQQFIYNEVNMRVQTNELLIAIKK